MPLRALQGCWRRFSAAYLMPRCRRCLLPLRYVFRLRFVTPCFADAARARLEEYEQRDETPMPLAAMLMLPLFADAHFSAPLLPMLRRHGFDASAMLLFFAVYTLLMSLMLRQPSRRRCRCCFERCLFFRRHAADASPFSPPRCRFLILMLPLFAICCCCARIYAAVLCAMPRRYAFLTPLRCHAIFSSLSMMMPSQRRRF